MTVPTRRGFTGRHMLTIMVLFFATVISVNVTMAVFAARTFGGKVVDNSYVATQRFNGWLAEARAQEQLGWSQNVALDAGRLIELRVRSGNGVVAGAEVTAIARHPVGRADDVTLRLAEVGPGRYRSTEALPAGRWDVQFTIDAGGSRKRFIEALQ
jgi:nitrogen fixation protein FixH